MATQENRKVTPNHAKLAKTTFAFEKNLIAFTMEAHQPKADAEVVKSADLIKYFVTRKQNYLQKLTKCNALVASRKRPDPQATISKYTEKQLRARTHEDDLSNMAQFYPRNHAGIFCTYQ